MKLLPQVQLSVLTKFSGPLTKQLSLVNGKVISDSSECRMSNGISERLSIPFNELPTRMKALGATQAITTGWVDSEAVEAEIITREKFEENNYNYPAHRAPHGVYATRTLSSMTQRGPSLIMFDHDHDDASPFQLNDPEAFISTLAKVVPDFDKVTYVRTFSTSSGIYHSQTGECLRPADGYHIYMMIPEGADLQRFGEVLEKRLWLAGLGYIKVSAKNGAMLKRTVVDTAVFSPERLIFEAGATILPGNPIHQNLPEPQFIERPIMFLDTSKLENLSDAEEQAYQESIRQAQNSELVQTAKQRVKDGLVERYVTEAQLQGKFISRRMAERMVEGLERHILPPFHPIMLSDGTVVSIAELVSNPFKYDGRSCFDPLRPDKGPDRAKFFGNTDQAVPNPVIYSFVEGGRTFSLRDSLRLLSQYSNEDQSDDLKQVSNRYIYQSKQYFDDFELYPGITLVKGEKGTGKTYRVAQIVKDMVNDNQDSVLAITHRVSLTNALAKSFDLACYNEREVSSPTVLRAQLRLGICYDSLHKIAGQTYKVVVIDEITQLMRHIKSKSVKNKFICLNVLRSIIQNAEYVILMDADLALPFIELLQDKEFGCIRERSALNVVVNGYLPAKHQKRKARVYRKDDKPDEQGWQKSLIEHAKENGTFVATNSKAHAYRVANLVAKHLGHDGDPITSGAFITNVKGRRIITLTSDNTAENGVNEFIADLNTQLLDDDILIASPSMGTGVSIDARDGEPRFKRTYGRFSRRAGNTSGDCSQHLARVRQCTDYELVIVDTNELEDVDPATIIDKAITQRIQMIDRQVNVDDRFACNFDPVLRKYVFSDAGWSEWMGRLTAFENIDRNDFADNIMNRLDQEGYTVEQLISGMSVAEVEALQAEVKELSGLQKEFELKLLCDEHLITDEELSDLETKVSLTMAEKRQLKKRQTADVFGVYEDTLLNEYLALKDRELTARKNGLFFGMYGETLFIIDIINRLDPEKNHIEKSTYFNKWTFMWQLADFIGLNRDENNLPYHNSMVISADIRDCVYEFLWENRKDIKLLFNKGIKALHKPVYEKERHRLVGDFLSTVGIKLKKKQRSVGDFYYQVDPDSIERIRQEVLRAREHSPHAWYKVIQSPPKFLLAYVAQWKAGTPEKVPHIHRYVRQLTTYHAAVFSNFMTRMANELDESGTNNDE